MKGKRPVVHASEDGRKHTFEADLIVHGAGRVPEIEDLDLDRTGVEYGKKGVSVRYTYPSHSDDVSYMV